MTRFRLAALALPERHRKFAREVFSIVLGVLIALGIGELADKLRWQRRIDHAMVAIRGELSVNRWNFVERGIYQPCLEQRLTTIGEILQDARRTHALPTIVNVGKPSIRPTAIYAY